MGKLVFFCALIAALPLVARAPQALEVVSVKPNGLGGPPRRLGTEGDRFIAENYPLILIIMRAYASPGAVLLRDQVVGGPTWINIDRFDIEAKIDGESRAIPTERVWLMVQSLLEDRFHLKVHHETRQLPVYDLAVTRTGIRMKLSADQTAPDLEEQPDVDPRFNPLLAPARGLVTTTYTNSGETVLTGAAIPVSPDITVQRPHALPAQSLTLVLSSNVGRPVVDKTNLQGLFDFRLTFVRDQLSGAVEGSGPSIFTALQEQLGLKLESAKGPVDVIVIDNVEKPSEN